MSKVGRTVTFRPHDDHAHLAPFETLAAIVGAMNADGSASLFVLVPNREPVWMDAVPAGDGPYSWTDEVKKSAATLDARLQGLAQAAADAQATAEAAHGVADQTKVMVTTALASAAPVVAPAT